MRPLTTAAAVATTLTILTTAGCGATAQQPTKTITVTALPKLPTMAKPAPLGTQEAGDQVLVTALKFRPHIPVAQGLDDPAWAAALIKLCATSNKQPNGKPLVVSSQAWQISTADGGMFNPTGWNGVGPLPSYSATGTRLVKGQCIKGWIVFTVAKGAKISRIIYSNGSGQPIFWSVKP